MLKERFEFTITFSADRDMVSGWGHEIEDWQALIERQLNINPHYNTKTVITSAKKIAD
jgi:hypothetical protein